MTVDNSKKPQQHDTPVSEKEPKGYSRRQFLQGAVLGAVGAAAVTAGVATILWPDEAPAPAEPPSTPAPASEPAPAAPAVTLPPYAVPARPYGYINVDASKCVGCRLCEYECAIFHTGEANPTKSFIRVHYFNPPVDVPTVCQQCADAPCMAACPPRIAAISKDENTGALKIDETKCTGCGLCVDACRTGCIRIDKETMLATGICDLCGGDPSCLKVCPSGAIFRTSTSVQGAYYAARPEVVAQQLAIRLYQV